MRVWRNGARKRVCDVSEDSKIVIIEIKGYKTQFIGHKGIWVPTAVFCFI